MQINIYQCHYSSRSACYDLLLWIIENICSENIKSKLCYIKKKSCVKPENWFRVIFLVPSYLLARNRKQPISLNRQHKCSVMNYEWSERSLTLQQRHHLSYNNYREVTFDYDYLTVHHHHYDNHVVPTMKESSYFIWSKQT